MSTHAAADRAAPALDPAALDANTMSNAALQAELFQLFFDQAPSHLGAMRAALVAGDRRAWSEGAHAIKGTARTLGLMRLAELTARAEASTPSASLLDAVEAAHLDAVEAARPYAKG